MLDYEFVPEPSHLMTNYQKRIFDMMRPGIWYETRHLHTKRQTMEALQKAGYVTSRINPYPDLRTICLKYHRHVSLYLEWTLTPLGIEEYEKCQLIVKPMIQRKHQSV